MLFCLIKRNVLHDLGAVAVWLLSNGWELFVVSRWFDHSILGLFHHASGSSFKASVRLPSIA